MATYRAVLFDWMLTLAHYPTDAEFCRTALASLGREIDDAVVADYVTAIERARSSPTMVEKLRLEDVAIEQHRSINMEVFDEAGLDNELAESLYALLGHVDMHPLYPDTIDVLASICQVGCQVAVVSDVHVDLRCHADQFGIADFVSHWSLSFELGVQKPDPLMFMSALAALDVRPSEALMVGDRVSRDGAASRCGIDTLILPTSWVYQPRGLEKVARLVG